MPLEAVPAIFIDRDGVVIENRPAYVRSLADVSILSQAQAALSLAASMPYKVILVTNQSVVGRGLISVGLARQINDCVVQRIQAGGGRIDAVYMCPHQPVDACECRKPKPGLLWKARDEMNLDLTRSIMIGDALSDVQAGQAASLPTNVLVLTGRGAEQAHLPEAAAMPPFLTYPDLFHALVNLIVSPD